MTLTQRLAEWMNGLRSYRVALRASGLFGRSVKLRRAGRKQEALNVAREALALLGTPVVRRCAAAECSGILTLTILVEQLATELAVPGAAQRDLADSLDFLRSLPHNVKGQVADIRREWLPYLESRVVPTRTS